MDRNMDRKRILIIVPSIALGWGAERVVCLIWNQLLRREYDVKMLCFYKSKSEYDFDWEIIQLQEELSHSLFINIYKFFRRAFKIKKICKKEDIDIVFSHTEEANFSTIISNILFHNRSKIFVQTHIWLESLSNLYKLLIKILYPRVSNITIAKENELTFIQDYKVSKEKIITIPNPIEIEKIKKLKIEKIETNTELFSNGKFTVINIGRLADQKNHLLLIKSFHLFHKKYPNSQLIILGQWDNKKLLENEIQRLNNPNIHLLWNKKNVYQYIYHSHCFVLSSNYEWLPVVLLEASACWVPIISTDCKTWPKEILNDEQDNFTPLTDILYATYGILVPTKNINLLVNAMETIMTQKKLQKIYSQQSIKRAQDYDISIIIEKLEILFFWDK